MAIFETERLTARRLHLGDLEAMVAIYGDLETVRYVGDAEPLNLEQCRQWIEITDRNFETRGYGMIALEDRETGDLIACAGIVHPGGVEQGEVKYALRKDQWGKGYATEIVQALCDYGRSNWGLTRIIATVDPNNVNSQKVLTKTGFRHAEDRANDDGSITQVWEA